MKNERTVSTIIVSLITALLYGALSPFRDDRLWALVSALHPTYQAGRNRAFITILRDTSNMIDSEVLGINKSVDILYGSKIKSP